MTSKDAAAATSAATTALDTKTDTPPKQPADGTNSENIAPEETVPFVAPGPGALSSAKPGPDVPYGKSGQVDYDAVQFPVLFLE